MVFIRIQKSFAKESESDGLCWKIDSFLLELEFRKIDFIYTQKMGKNTSNELKFGKNMNSFGLNQNPGAFYKRIRIVRFIRENRTFFTGANYLYYNSQCLSVFLSRCLFVCPVAVTFALAVFRLSVYTFWKVLI